MIKIGVLGSGSMGAGIAQVAATAGHQVYLVDHKPEALAGAKKKLNKFINRLVEKNRLIEERARSILDSLHYENDLQVFEKVDMVIEAIIEDLEIKKKVFLQLEGIVAQNCVLATNTSSLSIASIASACRHSDRVIGIHFFNPAPLMKLVEIIPAVQTSKNILDRSRELLDDWGKTTVIAKDTPGFIVNRIARPYYGEALRILEEGIANAATIDWALTTYGGFKMGPFTLMDYIGLDVNYKVTETVFKEFFYEPRYKPSFTQKRLFEAGYLGRKTGKGFYTYQEGDILDRVPIEDRSLAKYIVDRILVMLINEAADALYLKIASKEDIDLAMTLGVNYPKGLLRWADEIGIQQCVDQMDQLYKEYLEDRYRCSVLLRKMIREGKTFY